jgi:putative ABC transport system permease protein
VTSQTSAITDAVHQVDSELPLIRVLTMQDVIDTSISQQRFNMMLLGGFAGLALLFAAIGLAIGLAGALALGRVLANLIYGVKPTDPATFAAVLVLLAGARLLASVIPAYRATRVEPMKTLRDE